MASSSSPRWPSPPKLERVSTRPLGRIRSAQSSRSRDIPSMGQSHMSFDDENDVTVLIMNSKSWTDAVPAVVPVDEGSSSSSSTPSVEDRPNSSSWQQTTTPEITDEGSFLEWIERGLSYITCDDCGGGSSERAPAEHVVPYTAPVTSSPQAVPLPPSVSFDRVRSSRSGMYSHQAASNMSFMTASSMDSATEPEALLRQHLPSIKRTYTALHEVFLDTLLEEQRRQIAEDAASATPENSSLAGSAASRTPSSGSLRRHRFACDGSQSSPKFKHDSSALEEDSLGSGSVSRRRLRFRIKSPLRRRRTNSLGSYHSNPDPQEYKAFTPPASPERQPSGLRSESSGWEFSNLSEDVLSSSSGLPPLAPMPTLPVPILDAEERSACQKVRSTRKLLSRGNSTGTQLTPELFVRSSCLLQKDKGKGQPTGNAISVEGRELTLEKLRQKMELLCQVALSSHINTQQDIPSIITSTSSTFDDSSPPPSPIKSSSPKRKSKKKRGSGAAEMKRMKAIVTDISDQYVETRSMLELRMGFLSMKYGILLRWDVTAALSAMSSSEVEAEPLIDLVVLRKMCSESFLRNEFLVEDKYNNNAKSSNGSIHGSLTNSDGSFMHVPTDIREYDRGVETVEPSSNLTERPSVTMDDKDVHAAVQKSASRNLHTEESYELKRLQYGHNAIIDNSRDEDDENFLGTEVQLLGPPYRVPRPMAFDSSFLSVTVLRANGLADGAVNPFVRILLGDELLFKTKAIKSCRNPVWTRKNMVRFVAPSSYAGSDERLTVEIWDKRPSLRVDRFLSVVYVPLASLPAMPPTDARAAEITLPCRPYGTVTLELLHHSEAGSWLHQELRARKQQPEQAQNSMNPKVVVSQTESDPHPRTTCTSSSTSAVDHCCLF